MYVTGFHEQSTLNAQETNYFVDLNNTKFLLN